MVIKLILLTVERINKKTIRIYFCFRSLVLSEDASDSVIEFFPKLILWHIESPIDEDVGPVYFGVILIDLSFIENLFVGLFDNFYFLWSASSNGFYPIESITTRFEGCSVGVSNFR